MLKPITRFIRRKILRFLNKPVRRYRCYQFIPLADLETTLRPGDVLLVDGNQRISTAIKYVTQSNWSHAAFYVGRKANLRDAFGHPASLIEADVEQGVIAVSLTKYLGYNTRICRPALITPSDREKVIAYMVDALGYEYDLKNVVDLAHHLLPLWRRSLKRLGSGESSRAICSSLIARAFHHVRYPVLPEITRENKREIMNILHHSLFTPRDFNLSPYFDIVKPTIEKRPDYKTMEWRHYDELAEDAPRA